MFSNSLRRIGSLALALAGFLAGPVLMLLVCFAVSVIVVGTQFLLAVPLLLPVVLPIVAGFVWLKNRKKSNQSSVLLDISH